MNLVVAYSAGGQADAVARTLVQALQSALGQLVVIDNLPGVGGSLGAQKVRTAPPDGYTVLFGTPIELVQTPMAVASVKYKPENFRMRGPVASTYLMMIVRADPPVASMVDFVALAKKSSAKELSHGSVGRGTAGLPPGGRTVCARDWREGAACAVQGGPATDQRPGGRADRHGISGAGRTHSAALRDALTDPKVRASHGSHGRATRRTDGSSAGGAFLWLRDCAVPPRR